jgi:uncharacterized protein
MSRERKPKSPKKLPDPTAKFHRAVRRVLERLGQSKVAPVTAEQVFVAAQPAPGVLPKGQEFAMDDAFGGLMAFAVSTVGSAFHEGMGFLGYPYLSELAQRAEYRVISETIATEMTRKWGKVTAVGDDEDKTDKVERLNKFMTDLGVAQAFRTATEHDGFFGRSHVYLDTGQTDDRQELKMSIGDGTGSLSKAKKVTIKALRNVEPIWAYPTSYDSNNPLKPTWYRPTTWYVMGQEVHTSRFLTFVSREVPDLLKPAYSFGGLSLSQMAKPYVDNWLRTRQSVADLIHAFTVFVLATDLGTSLESGGDELFERIELFNRIRDNRGLMVLNNGKEEFKNVSAPLGGLSELQGQTQEHMAAVSRIPIVKLLGIQPMGLNASSEGEIRVFYDTIAASQKRLYDAPLKTIMNFCQLAEFGEVDPGLGWQWEPLWALTEKEEAELRKLEAETDDILIAAHTIAPIDSRRRIAADQGSPYAGLDIDETQEEIDAELEAAMEQGEPTGGANIDIRGTQRPPQFVKRPNGGEKPGGTA